MVLREAFASALPARFPTQGRFADRRGRTSFSVPAIMSRAAGVRTSGSRTALQGKSRTSANRVQTSTDEKRITSQLIRIYESAIQTQKEARA